MITHAVGIVFENEDREVLLLLRNKLDPEGGKWGLVGGKIDPGETAIAAAVREAEEEIKHGVDPDKLEFLRSYDWNREDIALRFEVYKLKVKKKEVNPDLADNENTEYRWMSPAKAVVRPDLMIGLYEILKDFYAL